MEGCLDNRRKMYQVLDPLGGPTPGTWRCQVHRGCVHNELTGLLGRVLGPVPEPTLAGLADLKVGVKRITAMLRSKRVFERMTYEEICSGYSGSKRTRYERAAADLRAEPCEKRDARITAFVKSEKRREVDEKDPRMIQFRTPKYNLELATYLKPIEHALLAHRGPRRGVKRSYVIAKGRDSVERARLIREKWDQFGDPVCVPLDATRFDKHVAAGALQTEHASYNAIWSDPYLAKLLSWQVVNKGRTMNWIKYKVRGNRMSGDYNTGMGNCLLMAAMVEQFCLSLKLKRWDYFADSDDCLVFVERSDLDALLNTVHSYFLSFGQEVRVEGGIAHRMQDIRHCQGAPFATAAGLRMVRDWRKVLSQAFSGFNHYHEPRGGMRVMKSVAQCELVLNAGVPILQPLSLRILHLLEEQKFAALDLRDTVTWLALVEVRRRGLDWTADASLPLTAEVRAEFERVFGLTTVEQLAWEAWIAGLTFENINLTRMVQRHPEQSQHYF